MRHFQDVHGETIRCVVCNYELPGSRKYLMANHFQRKHPGQRVSYSVSMRPAPESPSPSPVFPKYRPKSISKCRSPVSSRKSTARERTPSKKTLPPSPSKKQKQQNHQEKENAANKILTPLRSPSLSISLRGSPEPVTLYGLDEEGPVSPLLSMPVVFEPPRKITRRSPDAVFHNTDKSESATVPQLPISPPKNQLLALVEAAVPDLSSLIEDNVGNQPSTLTGNGSSGAAAGSESAPVPETLPSKPVDVFPSAPQYVLHKCDQPPTDTSAYAPNDPRIFFAGAPSSTKNDFVACLLRRANMEARKSAGRKVTWVPSGASSITKVEELVLPDGRIYRLKSILTPDPEYTLTAEASSQTSPSISAEALTEKKDVSTQVSTKQTYTLE